MDKFEIAQRQHAHVSQIQVPLDKSDRSVAKNLLDLSKSEYLHHNHQKKTVVKTGALASSFRFLWFDKL